MKQVRVTADKQTLATDSGGNAERIAAFEYEYNTSLDGEYYDAGRESGAKLEVKSTFREIGQKTQTAGRFRIPEPQHKRLLRRDRSGSAFYAFVLYDGSTSGEFPKSAYLKRLNPSSVGNLIGALGGFETSGHTGFDREKKLSWKAVFNPEKL